MTTLNGVLDPSNIIDEIEFETMARPEPAELLAFYARQNHAGAMPEDKVRRMLDNTFCLVTARRGGELIGFARGVTDGFWGRLAECKLDPEYQGPACITRRDGRIEHDAGGIAREMARRVLESLRQFGVERIDALAYGTEVDFCEELGFRKLRALVPMELPADAPLPHPAEPAAAMTS